MVVRLVLLKMMLVFLLFSLSCSFFRLLVLVWMMCCLVVVELVNVSLVMFGCLVRYWLVMLLRFGMMLMMLFGRFVLCISLVIFSVDSGVILVGFIIM